MMVVVVTWDVQESVALGDAVGTVGVDHVCGVCVWCCEDVEGVCREEGRAKERGQKKSRKFARGTIAQRYLWWRSRRRPLQKSRPGSHPTSPLSLSLPN